MEVSLECALGKCAEGGTANPAVLVAGMHAPPDVETTVDGLPALRQQQATAGASHPPRSVGGTHKNTQTHESAHSHPPAPIWYRPLSLTQCCHVGATHM